MQWIPNHNQRRTFLVVTLITIILMIGGYSFIRCNDKIGDPFLGFFYNENLMVAASQRAEWPGVLQGVKPLDRIVKVDNLHFTGATALVKYLWSRRDSRNAPILVELIRPSGERYQVSYPLPAYSLNDFLVIFVAPCLLGLVFFLMGCALFFVRPQHELSLVYFLFCSLISLAAVIHFAAFSDFTFAKLLSLSPLLTASSFHLFTLFPEKLPFKRLHWAVAAVYGLAIILVLLNQLSAIQMEWFAVSSMVETGYLLFVILADLLLMLTLYHRSQNAATQDKLKVLFLGYALGTPLILIWSVGYLFNREIFYLDQAMLLFLLFPLFLGYATLKRNILDIDRVIRLGLSYGLLGGGVLVIYLFAFGVLGQISPQINPKTSPIVFIAVVVLAALVVAKSFDGVQSYLMRHIFKGRYSIITTLKEFIDRLSRVSNYQEIQETLVDRLVDQLALRGGAFLDYAVSGTSGHYSIIRSQRLEREGLAKIPWVELVHSLPIQDNLFTVDDLSEHPGIPGLAIDELTRGNIRILLKLNQKHSYPALLLLAERQEGKEFSREIHELLSTIAKQASISLENAKLQVLDAERERLAALGKVASIMIHEIKNPLGIIRISSEAISKRFAKDETMKELAGIVVDEISRMDSTIQKFLNFAKPDPLIIKPFNPHGLLSDIIRKMRPDYQQSKIELKTELTDIAILLPGDEEKIRRLIYNLLINAKEALREKFQGGSVVLATAVEAKHFKITVEDNGQGMDESTLAQIFEPFFTTKSGGSGLGLAIVKQIVEEHQGEIVVHSRPRIGTRFEITLPRWLDAQPALHAAMR